MIKLKNLLLENPQTAPAPTKPDTKPDVKPDTPSKPSPRRRSVPSPSTSPTPAPKAIMGEESDIMKKIVDRYMKAFKDLHEAE